MHRNISCRPSLLGGSLRLSDKGPTYASKAFREFLQQWGAEQKKGIHYSPTGKAVIECTHQILKQVLEQQKESRVKTPQLHLCHMLFTISFLNCSFEDLNPPVLRHFQQNSLKLKEHLPVLLEDPETWQT